MHLFVTRRGDCGESHLLRTICHSVTKLLILSWGDPLKTRVLLFAPTGVADININATTIYSRLVINCKGQLYTLNDKQKAL